MATAKQKLQAFKSKVDKLVIGKVGSINGLGTNVNIKKYTFTLDNRGENATKTLVSIVNTRGIFVDINYDNSMMLGDLVLHKNDLRIILPVDVVLETDSTYIYELEYDGKTYDISPIGVLGKHNDTTGVAKEIFVSLQK